MTGYLFDMSNVHIKVIQKDADTCPASCMATEKRMFWLYDFDFLHTNVTPYRYRGVNLGYLCCIFKI